MDWSSSFNQFLNQTTETQKRLFKSWASAMSEMQDFNTPNMRESFDSALNFQEQIISGSLEFQAVVARLAIESQKQFWQNYFNTLRSK